MTTSRYLADLVAEQLAKRGMPGTVRIHPHKPLAQRVQSGERAMFVVEYEGAGMANLTVDEYQISSGTVGASVVTALANLIERHRERERTAA
jgi:hypothetical protein